MAQPTERSKEKEIQIDEVRHVSANVFRVKGDICEFAEKEEGTRSAPVEIVARTGKPVQHGYWGLVVHDLAGMHLDKPRIALDYMHDPDQVIGYLNKFDVNNQRLLCSGAVLALRDEDRGSEIIARAQAGIPYEASIYFGGTGIKIEELDKGDKANVNGYTVEGPVTIIREWPLRAVAICPYGVDQHTKSEFADGDMIPVIVTKHKECRMSQPEETGAEGRQPDEVLKKSANSDELAQPDDAPIQQPSQVPDAPSPEALLQQREADGKPFLEAFGEQGAVWFAGGKSFEEAQGLYMELLETRVKELEQRLSAVDRGEDDPVSFVEAPERAETATREAGLRLRIGENLAKLAANMRFAKAGQTQSTTN